DLRGPDGPTTLKCESCHSSANAAAGPDRHADGRMARVTYVRNCAACHPLWFDPLLDRQAPHDKTDVVHAVVLQALTDFIARHPDEIRAPGPTRGRIPVNFPDPPQAPARNAKEWLELRVAAVERLLWGKTCAECHAMEPVTASSPIPRTAPTNVPTT